MGRSTVNGMFQSGASGLSGTSGFSGTSGISGYSGLGLSGFSGANAAVKDTFTQSAHPFAVGDCLYHNGTAWAKSKADAIATAEVHCVVESVPSSSTFVAVFHGEIVLSGMTGGADYFLSAASQGLLTSTKPNTVGQVVKPVLACSSATRGFVNIMLGVEVASTSQAAQSILANATGSTAAPTAVTVAEQTLVGRVTGGNVDDLTVAQVTSMLSVDSSNLLINGGFDFAQRQAPGNLSTIADDAYGPDRWRCMNSEGNSNLQYQRNDALSETGLTSRWYGRFKKITNVGQLAIAQIVEGADSAPLRGQTAIFQAKMKVSSSCTINMAIYELSSAGTMDSIPAAMITAWAATPTFGANISLVGSIAAKSVTTSWDNYTVSAALPSNSKNFIALIWSNANFAANDTIDIAETGFYRGSNTRPWLPRSYSDEMTLCRRFCQKSYSIDDGPGSIVSGIQFQAGNTGGESAPTIFFSPPLRNASITVLIASPVTGAASKKRDYISGTDEDMTTFNVLTTTHLSGGPTNIAGHVYGYHYLLSSEL